MNVNTPWVIGFLQGLARHLRGPIIVIWDRLTVHRALRVTRYVEQHPRLQMVFLPPYAPELNPVETFWSYLKVNPLANLAAENTYQLDRIARRHTQRIRRRQDLLRSFIRATPLSLRL